MRILVFGGTGRVGSRFLNYAHAAGHELTAYVRSPGKVPKLDGLRMVEADLEDDEEMAAALQGQDAVVSALGVSSFAEPIRLLSDAALLMTSLMPQAGVKRILTVAGAGILDSEAGRLKKQDPGFPLFLVPISDEHERVWRILKQAGLDWTLACPPTMNERVRTGHYRLLAHRHPPGGSSISVEDVADFLLTELQTPQFITQRVGIAY